MSGYVNVNGEKKKISSIVANVNGERKKVTSAWASKEGVAVKIWDSSLNMYVARTAGNLLYSRDGVLWNAPQSVPTYKDTLEGLLYDSVGDRFVAYGMSYYTSDKGGVVWISNDGKSWTRKQFLPRSSSFRWTKTRMIVHEGKFYALTQDSSAGRTYLFTTEDFSTFSQIELFTTTTAYTGEMRLPQKVNIINGKLCFITRNYSCYAPLDQVLDTAAWVYEFIFTPTVYMLDKYTYQNQEVILKTQDGVPVSSGAKTDPYVQHSTDSIAIADFNVSQYNGADISIEDFADVIGSVDFYGTSYLSKDEVGIMLYIDDGIYSDGYFGCLYVGKMSERGALFERQIKMDEGIKPVYAYTLNNKTYICASGAAAGTYVLDDLTDTSALLTKVNENVVYDVAKKEVS